MDFTKLLKTPGEHSLMLQGLIGSLEAILNVPQEIITSYVAFLGHPHSLQGGTMNNKVVTTMARVFKELGIPSLRFNFRGVGQSAGGYDDGIGESQDMIALAHKWQQEEPQVQFIFAGFSFGSYVAYRTAAQLAHALLITIAPPVHHYDYREFTPQPSKWVVVQGDADEVVPSSLVLDFAKQSSPPLPVIEFADTGHFFHGKLLELKSQLIECIKAQVDLL
jgi:alpha/beta superfamily hydrolase